MFVTTFKLEMNTEIDLELVSKILENIRKLLENNAEKYCEKYYEIHHGKYIHHSISSIKHQFVIKNNYSLSQIGTNKINKPLTSKQLTSLLAHNLKSMSSTSTSTVELDVESNVELMLNC